MTVRCVRCAGVDPKSIVCEFFRHGQCAKGFKCKFSHDLLVERKSAKIDIYHDAREGDEGETGSSGLRSAQIDAFWRKMVLIAWPARPSAACRREHV